MATTTLSVGPIAAAAVREVVRERGFQALVVLVCLAVLAGLALAELSAGQQLRVLMDVGLAGVRLGGLSAALLLGAGAVAREVERGSAAVILAAPVARWAWLLGRFGGVFVALVLLVAVAGVVLYAAGAALTALVRPPTLPAALAPALVELGGRLSAALLLVLVELALVAAVATMFSAFSSQLFALGCTLGLWVAGHYAPVAAQLAANAESAWTAIANAALWFVLPNVTVFAAAPGIAQGEVVPPAAVALSAAYGLAYAAAVLAIGCALFARRDV